MGTRWSCYGSRRAEAGRSGAGTRPERCSWALTSALVVSNGARSLRFYRRLGFKIATRSRNAGLAQSRLDGLPGARLRVFSLRPASADGRGLELLAYEPPGRSATAVHSGDIAADWTTVEMPGRGDAASRRVRDPDGHMLLLTG